MLIKRRRGDRLVIDLFLIIGRDDGVHVGIFAKTVNLVYKQNSAIVWKYNARWGGF